MVSALAVVNAAPAFDYAPKDAWFGTYDPGPGNLVLHFKRDLSSENTQVSTICPVHKHETGAKWYTIDGVPCTLENVKSMKCFAVLLTTYHIGQGYGTWIKGQDNIEHLETLLSDLGDDASAQKVRETFPKIFAKPLTIKPLPAPVPVLQPQSRRWRWPF